MGRNVRVRLNSAGVAALLNEQGVADDLHRRALLVAETARRSAPVRSGEYVDSIDVVDDHTDRARSRVTASAEHALVVESRTGTLAKALGEAGSL